MSRTSQYRPESPSDAWASSSILMAAVRSHPGGREARLVWGIPARAAPSIADWEGAAPVMRESHIGWYDRSTDVCWAVPMATAASSSS